MTNNFIACKTSSLLTADPNQLPLPSQLNLTIDGFSNIINNSRKWSMQLDDTIRAMLPILPANESMLEFSEYFEYRQNPKILRIRGHHALYSGSDVEFDGEHLDSVAHPKLVLWMGQKLNSIHVPCSVVGENSTGLVCPLPPIDQRVVSSKYSLFLDGFKFPSRNLNALLPEVLIYFHADPLVKPFDSVYLIKEKSQIITLHGSQLNSQLNYRIMLNNEHQCHVISGIQSSTDTALHCKLDLEEEEFNRLRGTDGNLTVAVGSLLFE